MSTEQLVQRVFDRPEIKRSRALSRLSIIAVDTILKTIPADTLTEGFDHFIRAFEKEGEPAFELSILTKDLIVHDFVFSVRDQRTIYMPLRRATDVDLQTFQPESSEGPEMEPYRAELHIFGAVRTLYYAVEGQRTLVQSLISYGQKCLRAIHSLE